MRAPDPSFPSISFVLSQLHTRPPPRGVPRHARPAGPRRAKSSPVLRRRQTASKFQPSAHPPHWPPQLDGDYLMTTIHHRRSTEPCSPARRAARSSCAITTDMLDDTDAIVITVQPPSPTDSVSSAASGSSASSSSAQSSSTSTSPPDALRFAPKARQRAKVKAIMRSVVDLMLFRWWGAPHPVLRAESQLSFDLCT